MVKSAERVRVGRRAEANLNGYERIGYEWMGRNCQYNSNVSGSRRSKDIQ